MISLQLAEWREEDHPRDERGRFTDALNDIGLQPSVPLGFDPDFDSEKRLFPQTGPPNSVLPPEGRRMGGTAYFDENGDLAGTMAWDGKAFKITVRPDKQRQGIASKMLDAAHEFGLDIADAVRSNRFTHAGRELVRSWLKRRLDSMQPRHFHAGNDLTAGGTRSTGNRVMVNGELRNVVWVTDDPERSKAEHAWAGNKRDQDELFITELVLPKGAKLFDTSDPKAISELREFLTSRGRGDLVRDSWDMIGKETFDWVSEGNELQKKLTQYPDAEIVAQEEKRGGAVYSQVKYRRSAGYAMFDDVLDQIAEMGYSGLTNLIDMRGRSTAIFDTPDVEKKLHERSMPDYGRSRYWKDFPETFKSQEPGERVKIDADGLSREVLSKMDRALKSMGYDTRGADDVRGMLRTRIAPSGEMSHPAWIEAYRRATGSRDARLKTKEAKAALKNVLWDRVRELGTTTDLREAGYIKPDGSLIDLSGKKEGGPMGTRSLDHREVGGTAGMQELMAEGYIRMDYNSGSLDISKAPTSDQYRLIAKLAQQHDGALVVDLEDGLGEPRDQDYNGGFYMRPERTFSREYPEGTRYERIKADIERFFNGDDPLPMRPFINSKMPSSYSSGANTEQLVKGVGDAGLDVGTSAAYLENRTPGQKRAYQATLRHLDRGGRVFVDSGAFTAHQAGGEVDFDAVLETYARFLDDAGDGAARVSVVAPDRIGDQDATVALWDAHKGKLAALAGRASVIYPLQGGDLSLSQLWDRVPTGGVAGIPANAAAIPHEQIVEFARESKPSAIHLLGISEGRAGDLVGAILRASPDTQITMDSNRTRAHVGKGRGITEARESGEALAQVLHEWAADALPTEIEHLSDADLRSYGEDMGVPGAMLGSMDRDEQLDMIGNIDRTSAGFVRWAKANRPEMFDAIAADASRYATALGLTRASKKQPTLDLSEIALTWREEDHPRKARGQAGGGQFTRKGEEGVGSSEAANEAGGGPEIEYAKKPFIPDPKDQPAFDFEEQPPRQPEPARPSIPSPFPMSKADYLRTTPSGLKVTVESIPLQQFPGIPDAEYEQLAKPLTVWKSVQNNPYGGWPIEKGEVYRMVITDYSEHTELICRGVETENGVSFLVLGVNSLSNRRQVVGGFEVGDIISRNFRGTGGLAITMGAMPKSVVLFAPEYNATRERFKKAAAKLRPDWPYAPKGKTISTLLSNELEAAGMFGEVQHDDQVDKLIALVNWRDMKLSQPEQDKWLDQTAITRANQMLAPVERDFLNTLDYVTKTPKPLPDEAKEWLDNYVSALPVGSAGSAGFAHALANRNPIAYRHFVGSLGKRWIADLGLDPMIGEHDARRKHHRLNDDLRNIFIHDVEDAFVTHGPNHRLQADWKTQAGKQRYLQAMARLLEPNRGKFAVSHADIDDVGEKVAAKLREMHRGTDEQEAAWRDPDNPNLYYRKVLVTSDAMDIVSERAPAPSHYTYEGTNNRDVPKALKEIARASLLRCMTLYPEDLRQRIDNSITGIAIVAQDDPMKPPPFSAAITSSHDDARFLVISQELLANERETVIDGIIRHELGHIADRLMQRKNERVAWVWAREKANPSVGLPSIADSMYGWSPSNTFVRDTLMDAYTGCFYTGMLGVPHPSSGANPSVMEIKNGTYETEIGSTSTELLMPYSKSSQLDAWKWWGAEQKVNRNAFEPWTKETEEKFATMKEVADSYFEEMIGIAATIYGAKYPPVPKLIAGTP